jgi:hypothetical protein
MIDDKMSKVFGQRCATHGIDLLLADIGKLFEEPIRLKTMLIKFVCAHGPVYDALEKADKSVQLFSVCDTRFA